MMVKNIGAKWCVMLLFLGLAALPGFALEVELHACQAFKAQITDLEFLTNDSFLVTDKQGSLYFSEGCNKNIQQVQYFQVKDHSELGLLGVAQRPGATEGEYEVFLYYSPASPSKVYTRLSMFTLDTGKAVPKLTGEKILLEIDQPYGNHDGGALKFGPDGHLYLGVGDGGSANDPHDHGQNPATLLGSIVRIAPDKSEKGYRIPTGNLQDFMGEAAPEILAMGLRNPWKLAFDSKGNLIVADVGQNKYEEISILAASKIGKQALNFGWRFKEGQACFRPAKNCERPGLVEADYQYERDFGASITGGETLMYGGNEYYVFADYVTGAIGVLDLAAPNKRVAERFERGKLWTTFGKSPTGEVLIANIGGEIFRLGLK